VTTDTIPTDPVRLSELRPGMPLSALVAVYGKNWPRMLPSSSFFYDESMGFLARIDIDGVIGSLTFAKAFPLSVEIGGLRTGMSVEEARAARNDLADAGIEPDAPKVRLFRLMLPQGIQLEGRFVADLMIAMQLSRPGAVYERKLDYPEPAEQAGAPFADPNFKLVVLEALHASHSIHLGRRDKLAEHLLGPGYAEMRDGYELLKPVYAWLTRYPLTAAHLAAVEELVFDAGNEIYTYAFPYWDGETDEFDVTSLEGIEQLVNLRRIDVTSLLLETDLSCLAGLSQLEHLDLGHGSYRGGESLLRLPKLKSLGCSEGAFADPALIPALRARGVTMQYY
jgi:hypothetical protein